MAEQHDMISPFEPGQVREQEGQRIISYGTSSYGYDVRCSTEFKIFTNINSAIVDPKTLMPAVLLISMQMSALFRQTRLLWLVPLSLLRFHAMF